MVLKMEAPQFRLCIPICGDSRYKVKASSSRHKAMSYGRMKEEEKRLEKEIENSA